ncbi:P-loop containing nucleoside triphosphate hydrolase protein [Lentinula detonsa]|uniref:DNA 3'-5' helicase n=1 Tax=Lentinula detonsa TaxID=2804962 RepID=A0A9W8U2L2_9AGAR|nr:P-loop containing nucleoside triphosphate hydrolase protein [Lentinula detonsa]
MDAQLVSELTGIRSITSEQDAEKRLQCIPKELVPWDFLWSLETKDRVVAYKFCLLLWSITKDTKTPQVPRKLQLEAALSVYQQRSTLVVAGTNSGKTLVVILLVLLQQPGSITVMLSPFKRLQETMVNDMKERYHLRAFAVNEDTPSDPDWWKSHVFNRKTKSLGAVDILVTTVEQCFRSDSGHLSQMGQLLRLPSFQQKVCYQVVDEIHEAFFSGTPLYGAHAFRPKWGCIDELRRLLSTVPVLGLTASCPGHIMASINKAMGTPTYFRLQSALNRQNITYAFHCVVGGLHVPENFRCLVSPTFCDPAKHMRILIFCDNKQLTWTVRNALESFLPDEWKGKGVVLHYHSFMSQAYLTQAHKAFTTEGGLCRFLVATSGESTGVDFPDVDIVVNAGLPPSRKDKLQRAGRLVRREGKQGIFLILYEPWVNEVDLSEYENEWIIDPDRPRKKLATHASCQRLDSFYKM